MKYIISFYKIDIWTTICPSFDLCNYFSLSRRNNYKWTADFCLLVLLNFSFVTLLLIGQFHSGPYLIMEALRGENIDSSMRKIFSIGLPFDPDPYQRCGEYCPEVKHAFAYPGPDPSIIQIIQIRPHLEHAVQFWSLHLRRDIDKIEKVQRRARKTILEIRNHSYQQWILDLDIISHVQRKLRVQLIVAW